MPRNGSGQYVLPPGSKGLPNTTIESARYNGVIDDIAADLNTPRPPSAGGTGAPSAEAGLANLGGVSLSYLDELFAGFIGAFAMDDAPEGWLICDGGAISRTAYARLFDRIGVTFGPGNGSSTFNKPDLRGEFIRGADLGRGVDTGRVFGSNQADDFKAHGHTGSATSAGAHTHPYTILTLVSGSVLQGYVSGSGWAPFATGDTTTSSGAHTHTVTVNSTGGTESRPKNVALLPCIKF